MLKLKNCPHCGGEVMLCKLNTMVSVAEFSIVCTECGLETRIYANPMANCCFDMGEAVRSITEKWNRRDRRILASKPQRTAPSKCQCFGGPILLVHFSGKVLDLAANHKE